MSENTPVSKDEIDLGQVLKIIGNFFEKVFNLVKDLILIIFNLLIRLLLLIKENILKFLIVAIGSFVIGFLIDEYTEPPFYSNMSIQPNFGSTNQIYSNIRYYNGLISSQDSTALSNTFGISETEAASLNMLYIQPVRDENEMLQKYDAFNKNIIDTINTPEIGYLKFKINIDPSEFLNHNVYAEGTDPLVFKKLEDSIIFSSSLLNNKYLVKNRNKELENYKVQDSALVHQEIKIDSLRAIYSKVMLKSAEKASTSGTNIQLAANQTKTYEMELFKLENNAKEERKELNSSKALKNDMINVLSGFQYRGLEVEIDIIEMKSVLFLIFGLSALFLFLFIKGLNSYLTKYKNKLDA